ncbi:hypothetical protein Ppa06_61060 [Planomonospora parontospora subsp. parontospora]|uniref:Uncharacterized protein n=2 Tax=Planomonospora parontospora TaxID=58119 RepID=A0AA37BFV1_9ACTN|nr:hypothetical protein [Planomonospora parontospora]GGK62105.1 hypothetical protein GCM10010126_21860 [Planomonospora parontospora]GII12308.1 hypothetical protein Ppa06_61060 [Planomonospora parontospora subsp. parontospora]
MRHLNPPDAGEEPVCGPCFSASRPPLPMGCAVCGHPPYDHGCLHVDEHDYQAPSGAQIRARQDLIRAARLDEQGMPATAWVRPSMCVPVAAEEAPVEEVPAVPVPRTAEPAPQAAPRPPVHGEPVWHQVESQTTFRPPVPAGPVWRPVEPREARAVRLARARVPAALQRARARAATVRSRPLRPASDVGRPIPGGPLPRGAGRLRAGCGPVSPPPTKRFPGYRTRPDPPGGGRRTRPRG